MALDLWSGGLCPDPVFALTAFCGCSWQDQWLMIGGKSAF